MKKNLIVLTIFLLLGCPEDTTTNVRVLNVSMYTAPETAPLVNLVNSVLLMGRQDAILVDAQLFKQDALNVVQLIKNSNKNLVGIFITHGHPDHYLGLAILQENFPTVPILASSAVVQDITAKAPAAFAQLKALFGGLIADSYVIPQVWDNSELQLEGLPLNLIPFSHGESVEASAIYSPDFKIFIAGDLVYSDVHLWLVEKQDSGWLQHLRAISTIGEIKTIYPGHGLERTLEVVRANEQYIQDFLNTVQTSASAGEAYSKMSLQYPLHKALLFLQYSTQAYFIR